MNELANVSSQCISPPLLCNLGHHSIKNDLSPNWVKVFKVDYELGSTVKVAVSIFDEVRKSENLPMGSCVFDIAEVLAARGNTKGKRVKGGGT
jgi:hypothetical protein